MRNAFLFLLLLNILAFAYQIWIIEPDNPVAPMHIAQDVPGLMLAERPDPPEESSEPEESAETAIAQPEAAPSYRCLRIGPFAQEADADKVQSSLQRREATVRQTEERGEVWVGHWVQVADQGTREKAESTRDALVKSGIRDAYILPGVDDQRISLGVYRQRGSADRIVQQAEELGFETRVQDRYQPGTNFWLRVRLPGDRTLQPGDIKSDSGQILRTETISCADAGI